MICRAFILCVAFLFPAYTNAQLSPERSAWHHLSKQRWERAHLITQKMLLHDTLQPTARYIRAHYFLAPENPNFQIDSAYYYIVTALQDFQKSTTRQRERLKRFPLDSMIIIQYRSQVDSAAFARASLENTEHAYINFIQSFPSARQLQRAMELRDDAAYGDAVKVSTYQAFENFMLRYPHTERAQEAKAHYEKLLYENKNQQKRLEGYDNFLKNYPASSYRAEAERNIFEISTAGGSIGSFENFLRQYPQSLEARGAKGILYHLLLDKRAEPALQHDSLSNAIPDTPPYLVPFLHGKSFGFMNAKGEEVIVAGSSELKSEYICGNVNEDFVLLPDKIVDRKGTRIYYGHATSAEDIGFGFLLIETKRCKKLIHKTGYIPADTCVENAKILGGRFLALQKNNVWSIFTFTGRQLLAYIFDEISVVGDVIVFKCGEKFKMTTFHAVAQIADQQPLNLNDAFDEVKHWPEGSIWVRAGKFQGVVDQQLNIQYPFSEDQQYIHSFFGALGFTANAWTFYNRKGESAKTYDTLLVNQPWLAAKTTMAGQWQLVRPLESFDPLAIYDSLFFAGPFAIGLKGDSSFVHFNKQHVWSDTKPTQFEFVPGQNSSAFLVMEQREKKTLYTQLGEKLFTSTFDRIQDIGGGFFIITRKEKKGLISSKGKLILPVEYSAIGSAKNGVVTLLKAMKFGLFNATSHKLIKPTYSKNLVQYSVHSVVAFKNGKHAFIDWNDKLLSGFEFDEINFWNDSIALVKKDYQWMFYHIYTKKVLLDKIKDYKLIRDTPNEKLAIIHYENKYGVMDSNKGIIIPLKFSDIINVGSAEEPLYFTEKHVEEASLFMVTYYSKEGKIVRKEVYGQEEYEMIYCSQH